LNRYCIDCQCSIGGGPPNFKTHELSKQRISNAAKANRLPTRSISTSFGQPLPKVTTRLLSPGTPPKTNPIPSPLNRIPYPYETINVDNPTGSGLSAGQALASDLIATDGLLTRLRAHARTLPLLVPLGTPLDLFASFSNNPEDLIEPGSDAWEDVIDPAFNRVIGFGLTTVSSPV